MATLTHRYSLSYGGRSDCYVTLALFSDVKNCTQLRSQASSGLIQAALLSTTLLCSEFHVLAAVNKAVMNRDQQQMRTRTVYSEIIYSLSPSTNISESFKHFGVRDDSTAVLVVVLHPDQEESLVESVLGLVEGELEPLDHLTQLADLTLVRKVYKISAEEATVSTLESSVVTRIATRDVT